MNMKHYMSNFKISLLLMTFMATFLFGVTSCKESDSSGGTPKITSVTNTDPNNQITYGKIGAGSLIVIRGHGIRGALAQLGQRAGGQQAGELVLREAVDV